MTEKSISRRDLIVNTGKLAAGATVLAATGKILVKAHDHRRHSGLSYIRRQVDEGRRCGVSHGCKG